MMNKTEVKKVERIVRYLINAEDRMTERHGWNDGNTIEAHWSEYVPEVKKIAEKKGYKQISGVVFHVLENINFHDLNKALDELGYYGKEGYYQATQDDYSEYEKLGGDSFL